MRIALSIVAIAGGVFALAGSAAAQNYPWCAQYSEDMGGSVNCGFVSFEQCMTNVRGLGGFCMANNRYVPPAGASAPKQRSVKHKAHQPS